MVRNSQKLQLALNSSNGGHTDLRVAVGNSLRSVCAVLTRDPHEGELQVRTPHGQYGVSLESHCVMAEWIQRTDDRRNFTDKIVGDCFIALHCYLKVFHVSREELNTENSSSKGTRDLRGHGHQLEIRPYMP
ncbi:hypothetical protein RRG08_045190 [Elysia crispata]|uniref:Uncharacterized protein n=1 Tax=Elysia crispata TaxID=231223 RepID=A0AAE1E6G5_9GAST|nr:hypothetical protein RRG08_045190 [Elysia crispata]